MHFSSDFQRSNCLYFFVNNDMFWNACVFASVYFWCCFGKVEGRNEVRGKSKELKTVEILCEMKNYGILYFSLIISFSKKYENWWIPRSIWLDPRNEIGDFHEISASIWFTFTIWSGRFGRAHVMVSVICKVAQRRPRHASAWVLWGPEIHCGGKGATKKRR